MSRHIFFLNQVNILVKILSQMPVEKLFSMFPQEIIKSAVIIYSIAITIMIGGSASYLNHSERSRLFRSCFFSGTVLFFISDAQLSLLLFNPALKTMPVWLNGILFYPAILLIACSVIFERKTKN